MDGVKKEKMFRALDFHSAMPYNENDVNNNGGVFMKRGIGIAAVLCLCLVLFAGCKDETPQAGVIKGGWHIDLESHWHEDEDGRRTDEQAHTPDARDVCTACGAEIVINADGSGEVNVYDEENDRIWRIFYDAEGNVESTSRTDMTYDESGNPLSSVVYINDTLVSETFYAYDSDGEAYAAKVTNYMDDGSKEVYTYNEYEATTSMTVYDADGNVTKAERYEITYDDSGDVLNEKTYRNGILVIERSYAPDAAGFHMLVEEILYDENGIMTITRYDLTGKVIEETTDTAPSGWNTTVTTTTATTTTAAASGTQGTTPSATGATSSTGTGSTTATTREDTTATTRVPDMMIDVIPGDVVGG